jgi:hypothetical protein
MKDDLVSQSQAIEALNAIHTDSRIPPHREMHESVLAISALPVVPTDDQTQNLMTLGPQPDWAFEYMQLQAKIQTFLCELTGWNVNQGPMTHFSVPLVPQSDELQEIVDEQAEDEGLWCQAANIVEAYLQQELRRLHTAIENRAPVPLDRLNEEGK